LNLAGETSTVIFEHTFHFGPPAVALLDPASKHHILASLSAHIRQSPEAKRRGPSLFTPEILNEFFNEFLGCITGDVLLVYRMRDMLVVQTNILSDNRDMVSGIQSKNESLVWAKTEFTHSLLSISEGTPPAASS
jgi:hypothetical protein